MMYAYPQVIAGPLEITGEEMLEMVGKKLG